MSFFKKLSLSTKTILLFLLAGMAIVQVMRLSVGSGFMHHYKTDILPHVRQYLVYVNQEIGNPPNLETAKQLSEKLNIRIHITGNNLDWKSYKNRNGPLENIITISNYPYITYFSYPDHWNIRLGGQQSQELFIRILSSVLLILIILYFLLRRNINPINTIKDGIKRIGSGDLNYRLNIKRLDELGELSQAINAMADDINNMLESKRQLLLSISHELRTPLTRSKIAVSLLDNNELKLGLKEDINQMENLINDLLEAERFNQRHQALNLTCVDINQLIKKVINKNYPESLIDLQLDNTIEQYKLDHVRLQFIVNNLINNALKYQQPITDTIVIKTTQTNKTVIISVRNKGDLIPKKHLIHLTEPFYQADPSRQHNNSNRAKNKTHGYGLGLYITKMIILAHHGELQIISNKTQGTVVTAILPKKS